MGGQCQQCGYKFNGYNIPAFQFHHRDPDQKDFKIGGVAHKSWDVLVEELKKCDLLCANCHNMIHSSPITTQFISEAQRYQK